MLYLTIFQNKREDFMDTINTNPIDKGLSKTIEPIVNSVSPQVKEERQKAGNIELNQAEDILYKIKNSPVKQSIEKSKQENPYDNKNNHSPNSKSEHKSQRASSAKQSRHSNIIVEDEKHITFEQQPNEHMAEQEVGNMYVPENEIINFEIKDNDEFKKGILIKSYLLHIDKPKENIDDKNVKEKGKKRKPKKMRNKAFKHTKTYNKDKHKSPHDQPLGDGIETDLLDFTDIKKMPDEKKKALKMTRQDQEYFSGAKKNIFDFK